MKKVYLVNGSPRGKNSCSQYLVAEVRDLLDSGKVMIEDICITECLKAKGEKEAFQKITAADCILFVFPLYVDSIPSHMLDFMYELDDYLKEAEKKGCKKYIDVYAIINNGFIEGDQNRNAAKIMQHFASSIGYNWRFAIGIGAGEFMRETQKSIPIQSKMKKGVYEALLTLKKDIEGGGVEVTKNIFTSPAIPRFLFMFSGERHWISQARKYKLSKKELLATPNQSLKKRDDNLVII